MMRSSGLVGVLVLGIGCGGADRVVYMVEPAPEVVPAPAPVPMPLRPVLLHLIPTPRAGKTATLRVRLASSRPIRTSCTA